MNFLHGTAIAGTTWLLMLMAGYAVAGFMAAETRLTRLAVASLVGLAWIVFGASAVGAVVPLSGPAAWLLWFPVPLAWLIPAARKQLWADIRAVAKSSLVHAAAGGFALLWVALLLPYLVYPDLAFFDGRANHDNFLWCTGAEYLQTHPYLSIPEENRAYPLFNGVKAFTGWKPIWGRIGTEGFLAVTGATFACPPVQSYNFLVSSLALPWVLAVLAIARRMGLPRLNGALLALVCFCQPVLIFFVANGNVPNLLGTIFGGGWWLLALLICDAPHRCWPLVAAGILLIHGAVASYPEILVFALLPVALLALRHFLQATEARGRPWLLLALVVAGGLCLNPLTTIRAWNGMINSIDQIRQDAYWANVFERLSFAGYVPSLFTLAVPSMRLLGLVGGAVASVGVLAGLGVLLRHSPRRALLLISLASFGAMLLYTAVTSFSYGWQKAAQFSGIYLAVLFPALLAGQAQEFFRQPRGRGLSLAVLSVSLAVVGLGTLGNTADSLQVAGIKGLTRPMLAWRERLRSEFPGQTVHVDGATFRASFFHSMWSARLFAHNPVVFISREDQAGGYLSESSTLANPAAATAASLYYVEANWARAFDYQPVPLAADRVGVVLRQHNLLADLAGFHRASGVPEWAKAEFSLTVFPYADGWLELTLAPNGKAAPDCQLAGSVTTETGAQPVTAVLDAEQRLVARFPLKAGTWNSLVARIAGAPALDPSSALPPYPFRISAVRTFRLARIFHTLLSGTTTHCEQCFPPLLPWDLSGLTAKPPGSFAFSPHSPAMFVEIPPQASADKERSPGQAPRHLIKTTMLPSPPLTVGAALCRDDFPNRGVKPLLQPSKPEQAPGYRTHSE